MVDSGSAAVEPGRTHVIRDARDIDPVWSQCPILRCSSLLHRGSGSPPRQLWGCRMKSGLQENASSSGSPAEPVGGFAASMAAQLTAPVEGFHGEPPISPATADDDFAKNLATKFAARFERLRAGAPSTPPPPNRGDFAAEDIDSREATDRLSSALASIRTGRVGIGFLLLSLFVAITVVVLWALPFRSSEQLPSSHIEQGKAVGLPAHDLTEQAPAPAVSPPPASASPVTLPGPAEVSSASQIPLFGQPPSPPLNADEIRELQGKLKVLGFDPGAIDGVVGPMTTSAVRKYSQARAMADADVTRDLLVRLRAEVPPKK